MKAFLAYLALWAPVAKAVLTATGHAPLAPDVDIALNWAAMVAAGGAGTFLHFLESPFQK